METTLEALPVWTLGDRLAKARTLAKIGVQEMADQLDVSRGTIRNYEADETRVPKPVVMAYAQLTGVPVWWLLDQQPAGDAFVERRREQLDITERGLAERRKGAASTKWYPSRDVLIDRERCAA